MENDEERLAQLVKDTLSILQDVCKKDSMQQIRDLQTELQQEKSYVLGLEDRIVSLESNLDTANKKYTEDTQTIGTQMASMQSTINELQGIIAKKKRRFWS